jgi:hypothetical protein
MGSQAAWLLEAPWIDTDVDPVASLANDLDGGLGRGVHYFGVPHSGQTPLTFPVRL